MAESAQEIQDINHAIKNKSTRIFFHVNRTCAAAYFYSNDKHGFVVADKLYGRNTWLLSSQHTVIPSAVALSGVAYV